MTFSFRLSSELQDFETQLREWSLREVRPRAREADSTKKAPADAAQVVESCPVDLSIVAGGNRTGDSRKHYAPCFQEGRALQTNVMYEALAYGDTWITDVLGQGIGHLVVELIGTEEQKEKWLEPVRSGRYKSTGFALTEPQCGSDASQLATTAERDGDFWILNGAKMYCSYGAVADYVTVFATLDRSLGAGGIRAFIVPAGTPGFMVTKANEDKMGLRSAVTSELRFEGCVIPVEHLIGWSSEDAGVASDGNAGSGLQAALQTLTYNRPNVTAVGIGLARAALDVAGAALRERRSGFAPHRWEAIDEELLRMVDALDRAQRVTRSAQWLRDGGHENRREASISKAYGPPIAERVIRRSMQLLGPDGTSKELLLEKWYRDVKIFDIYEGSGQIQRIVLSREFLGRSAARL